ncbi:hypothetical protein [Oscillatoria salina]|uniref:hypothetical protein n=1 Tax=Oscillatoria salina TaxID=331517 RepID=UPI0013B618E6|nr:hypothetical protein [Oscillatoria salina]MBZ8181841.1 hypothetical protein [Oscillatoria salina IIICB1]NET87061.1 hypothetical protein [Kamptonema sp. SIO1D9]
MAASDQFKEYIKEGKIFEALTLALSEAIELEITTWVSTANDNPNGSNPDRPVPGNCLRTRMNMVDGDIENEVGTQFIGNAPYTELREFHLEQVKEGRKTIQQNLESLQQMFVVLASTASQLPQASHRIKEGNPALSPSQEEDL